jgi:hypothetical protein
MNPTIKNHTEEIVGYKAFKKDDEGHLYTDGLGIGGKTIWKVGEAKECEGYPSLCENGYHFFRHYCFAIDYLEEGNMICKVKSLGPVQEDTEKCVTSKLEILSIEYIELNEYGNSGDRNSGDRNSGDRNSGYGNSGNGNSGNGNSGDRNSGDRNSGDGNSGNGNSGDRNSGNGNSGDGNSGNGNSGYGNSGDGNSGDGNSGDFNGGDGYLNYFCTETRFFLFDKEVDKSKIDLLNALDFSFFKLSEAGLKGYKKAWARIPDETLKKLKRILNIKTKEQKKKFFEITGLKP